ncbi:hypothetical protein SAMN04489758_1217 [Thomasclavelia cocleata]|uniref:DUF4935 domain-containing protein n=2 Tax=Thomasclavelia cocleata TaxID=69824 RepID=A0A1I0FNL4_9FIRM|nr:PIN domain-containing protein [Thomasclavelia cocleata]MCR1961432.1 PIN domain-containing protein [Thomasclavelia cocleata]NDO40951.1 hypothetical protein [Thomasclavelia cocleata]SET59957.1 hypothetical protein SAMN04489758_1217 [Thomasclavelia cocleata]
MNLSDETTYWLIFDTNALFQAYEKKADFTIFNFNATFENVIDMINQLDIYNQVTVAIPSVVWNEMEKQIIAKHDELLLTYKNTISKKRFPEYSIQENSTINYPEYIKIRIEEYKKEISEKLNKVIEIPIASNNRFKSIVNRAFDKLPPFEGKDKKSDKGFKDALLWESILEFALKHRNSKIIYYSKDNAFGEFLLKEFTENISDSSLFICKNESEVKIQLEEWALEIDKYSYQPIEDFDENKEIIDWLNSGDFLVQIIERDYGFVEQGRLITSTTAHLVSIDNIECLNKNEDSKEYYIETTLRIEYNLKDGGNISEIINAGIQVEKLEDVVFSVEDVYRINEDEDESET